jgi:hypothetical protein
MTSYVYDVIDVLLKRHVLSDICVKCFKVKEREKRRGRGMMVG